VLYTNELPRFRRWMLSKPCVEAVVRIMNARCFLLLYSLVLVGSSPAWSTETIVRRNIAYAEPAHERQRLDIYAPKDGSQHPIAIWIHGGGWKLGDKAAVQRKPEAFVEKGYVFVSVNYRFVPEVTVKEMAGDIAKAIKWIHDHAAEQGGSADQIFVMGHSAGAHLAALVCTDDRYLKAEGLSLANIKACVPVDTAAYDVGQLVKSLGPLRRTTYTSVFGQGEAGQKESSPLSHVANAAACG
jgi:arylformamidase